MRNFILSIQDRRYLLPSLVFVRAANKERARGSAKRSLATSADHRSVKVREDHKVLFGLGERMVDG
jgi:hypothetical protein